MPPVKVTRTAGNGAPTTDLTAEEAASIRAAVGGKEVAPSSRLQSVFNNWRDVADQLGDPFETERIALSQLRRMRRDPMIGFGLSFIKTPHVRARWYINAVDNTGPNAQIAAHLDENLRRVWSNFILQWCNSLDFGFQASVKRFEFRVPGGTFVETSDTGEQTETAIWSQGGIQPIAIKDFVPLRPEGVQPIWSNLGEFDGIEYSPAGTAYQTFLSSVGARATGGGAGGTNKEETFKLDLAHSLWITNEREQNFGSIFGYPRLGYAYKPWWSWHFRWAIADRAFEKKGDPSVIVYHPDGEFIDSNTGERTSYGEYALQVGERMRSGGVIALPSEVYEDSNGRGTIRQWEIDFTKDAVNFDPFDRSFDYLDVAKLRALWIPEQAFLEGKGGTSSRNVAAEMGESFVESQAVLNGQMINTINRYVIPQWLAVNYPEFVQAGGTAQVIVQGFGDEDVEFMRELVQLIGQQESGAREIQKMVDLQKVLRDRGVPVLSVDQQNQRDQKLQAEAQAANAPAPVAPGAGTVGLLPTATGFSYVQPSRTDIIMLADTGNAFISNLPKSVHYEDTTIRSFAKQLWNLYRDVYKDEYNSAVDALLAEDGDIELSDVELATPRQIADAIVARWKGTDRWPDALARTLDLFKRMAKRAASIELKRSKVDGALDDEEADTWIRDHVATFASQAATTTRTEVRDFIEREIEDGVLGREEIAAKAREHFSQFADWKADRLVRTEVRDVYNQATLMAAKSAGINRVQALDGQAGPTDEDCEDRNGQIFTVPAAMQETEHPNGTLGWRMVPTELSIRRREDLEDGALWDETTFLLTLSNDIDRRQENVILMNVVDELVAR